MGNIFKWIKEHKILVIIIMALLFFFPILIIHLLFKFSSKYEFFVAEWNAGDVLSYVSGFYALLGTIIFSMLALYQNHIINEQNEKINKKLREMEFQRDMPQFFIEHIGSNGNCLKLKIKINNISNNSAADVKISNLVIYDSNRKILHQAKNIYMDSSTIEANSSIDVNLQNPELYGSNLEICFCIEYQDKFLGYHQVEVTGIIPDCNNCGKIKFILGDK